MNEIVEYNEHHNNTDITGCNDIINNNEIWTNKEYDLDKLQPAPSPQGGHLNGKADRGEEVDVKKTCICGSILSDKFFTNTRKYYDGDSQYFKIKSAWVKHTTTCNNHKIFKLILEFIFFKRRYNKLKTCVKLTNKLLRYKNRIIKEKNDKGVWVSLKGCKIPEFIENLKLKKRAAQMKIKDKGHEPYAPIRPPC
jgi:hypothetical protein